MGIFKAPKPAPIPVAVTPDTAAADLEAARKAEDERLRRRGSSSTSYSSFSSFFDKQSSLGSKLGSG